METRFGFKIGSSGDSYSQSGNTLFLKCVCFTLALKAMITITKNILPTRSLPFTTYLALEYLIRDQ